MTFRLYNSLTKQVEEFRAADPRRITFYSCGPTVYDYAHIGNFRSFLGADLLRRWLESPLCEIRGLDGAAHRGPREVVHVMNITDVGHMTDDAGDSGEDRMQVAERRLLEQKKAGTLPPGAPADLDPRNPRDIADFYASAFLEDARLLGLKVAHEVGLDPTLMPRPSHKVAQMQTMIRSLLASKHAYMVGAPGAPGTAVYFDVQTFPEYGALSGNTLERLRAGAGGRVAAENQSAKRHPADFLLWKVDPSHVMKWPFEGVGEGYPGWHIECSAMARERLGDTIDLHSGGEDNIFPHHECEIAQSRCATGEPAFARHWFHVRHLMVEGDKMSKSRGNFYTIRDLLEKGGDEITPAAIRLELLKTHYRANANFTIQGLKDSARMTRRWSDLRASAPKQDGARNEEIAASFARAMSDDLNISAAIGVINAWVNATPAPTHADALLMEEFERALGLIDAAQRPEGRTGSADGDGAIQALVDARTAAKKAKDFAAADRIRAELAEMGVEVKDTPQGATWSRRSSL